MGAIANSLGATRGGIDIAHSAPTAIASGRQDGQNAIATKIASFLNDRSATLILDGASLSAGDAALLEAIASRLRHGSVILTTVDASSVERLGWVEVVQVEPLDEEAAVALFRKLTGRRPSKLLIARTLGHPVLIQFAARVTAALTQHDLQELLSAKSDEWLWESVLSSLSDEQKELLEACSIYRTGFAPEWVAEAPLKRVTLRELALAKLIIPAPGERYKVHELVRRLVEDRVPEGKLVELHLRAAEQIYSSKDRNVPAFLEYAHHTRLAGMNKEAIRVHVALVDHATQHGLWSLVMELTDTLDHEPNREVSYLWYQRGRALRLMERYEEALRCYRQAQASATDGNEHACVEEAAMLAYVGERSEAIAKYESLVGSDKLDVALHARLALGLMIGQDGDYARASDHLIGCIDVARESNLWRAETQALQVLGRVALTSGHTDEAIEHLRAAYELRMAHSEESVGPDVIGWRDLYRCLLDAEAERGERPGALSAARGLFRFSVLSSNPAYLAEATYELSAIAEDDDEEATHARSRLASLLESATSDEPVSEMSEFLAAARWCSGEFAHALRVILEFDRESEDSNPIYFVLREEMNESAKTRPGLEWRRAFRWGGAWVFAIPEDLGMKGFIELLEGLREEYPDSERLLMSISHSVSGPRGRTEPSNPA